jgi:arylsulfatase
MQREPKSSGAKSNDSSQPNILYFHVDNLGQGELGCYDGGLRRGAVTRRIDQFASQGLKLWHYVTEAQCTPSRSALITGRHPIRSGTHTVSFGGEEGGLVAWERTIGDILSEAGYATCCMGKWHIGAENGRFPTDHGFDEWYGIPRSYDECLWPEDPRYDPKRDPVAYTLEGDKANGIHENKNEQLTLELRRNIDREYEKRAFAFLRRSVQGRKPFFLYYNHSMMHLPNIPRDEFKGKSGYGDWADCLLELDGDFGKMLDLLDELGVADNTIVVFAGDNGPEEMMLYRGASGFYDGSYFTSSEGGLRTPCLIRWPGRIQANRESNEMVHVTDMFTTLLSLAGCSIPADRVIDGKDQSAFFKGQSEVSAREGVIIWVGPHLHGVKWKDYKALFIQTRYFFDSAPPLGFLKLIDLISDPKEREPINPQYLPTWVMAHCGRLLKEFQESVNREPPIPAGAPLDFVPVRKVRKTAA